MPRKTNALVADKVSYLIKKRARINLALNCSNVYLIFYATAKEIKDKTLITQIAGLTLAASPEQIFIAA